MIYSGHDSKDKLLIEVSDLIFVLKTDDVKEGSLQFLNTKFSLILNVVTIVNNNEINDIFQFSNVIFLKLNLLNIVVETKIEIYTSL